MTNTSNQELGLPGSRPGHDDLSPFDVGQGCGPVIGLETNLLHPGEARDQAAAGRAVSTTNVASMP